jgi:hypothetical protein
MSLESASLANPPNLVVATRLHLGQASSPPTNLAEKMAAFTAFCSSINAPGVIAVDATPKIPGYDFHQALQECVSEQCNISIIPVQPWGKFVPALNALLSHAANQKVKNILFISAETSAPVQAIDELLVHVDSNDDTLVAGAVLPGHKFRAGLESILDGLTSPWNTLAIWNVSKLSVTGFPLVSDGLLTSIGEQNFAGIEEVAATALLQSIFPDTCKSKLVKLDGVCWDQAFDDDPKRKQWHEEKMQSKLERSRRQLELLGLSGCGKVEHY